MWQITSIHNANQYAIAFSDGLPVLNSPRGGHGVSSRLIVNTQGFLDFTSIYIPLTKKLIVNLNGKVLTFPESSGTFALTLLGGGQFTVTQSQSTVDNPTLGTLKPLPTISDEDAAFIDRMIAQKYVPYPNIPDAPGKTEEQLRELGKQFFPFTPHSFQLAMIVYDWTTASFARLVFMKIFEYTAVHSSSGPFPLDQPSIAEQIWESNWPPYVPGNPDYMRSFLMKPAATLSDVQYQLENVGSDLQLFSTIENRLLKAAMESLPRTSLLHQRQLFSGQMDISTLGLSHLGIEMLECPLNAQADHTLEVDYATATSSFISAGKVITTKMVWSFTSTLSGAMHYENGLLLVANPPADGSWLWEACSDVVPLSDDDQKIEWTFPPGTSFLVQSFEQGAVIEDKKVDVLTLQPVPTDSSLGLLSGEPLGSLEKEALDVVRIHPAPIEQQARGGKLVHNHAERGKTNGRRCRCIDDAKAQA